MQLIKKRGEYWIVFNVLRYPNSNLFLKYYYIMNLNKKNMGADNTFGETNFINKNISLTIDEANQIRQWFDFVQDVGNEGLSKKDFLIAKKLYQFLDFRIPNSIINKTK